MSLFLQDKFMYFVARGIVFLIILSVAWFFIGPFYNQLLVLVTGSIAPGEVDLVARENMIYVYTATGTETIGGIYISALHYGLLLLIALIAATAGLGLGNRLKSCGVAVVLLFGILFLKSVKLKPR